MFVNSWKNILKLGELSMACRDSRIIGSNFRFLNSWKNILKLGELSMACRGANICTIRNVQIHASSDHFQTHHAGGVNSCI